MLNSRSTVEKPITPQPPHLTKQFCTPEKIVQYTYTHTYIYIYVCVYVYVYVCVYTHLNVFNNPSMFLCLL